MTKFRGCIDIHAGQVKQIVGGTLKDSDSAAVKTNFVADKSSSWYAELYRHNKVEGTHVIKLGPGCDEAAEAALKAWPQGLQIGGGITVDNAKTWLDKGAAKVIVTSYLFPDGKFSMERLKMLVDSVGRDKLVIDLSCRRQTNGDWVVAMNRWQTLTDMKVDRDTLEMLSDYCSEFLVHAADVEGLCQGIDEQLVEALAGWVRLPTVYAGGAKSIEDLSLVERLSGGKVDLTYGSALDIFGGEQVKFEDCVRWNERS